MTKITQKKTASESAPALISNSKLQQMYTSMLKCRILESHARKITGRRLPSIGKEAAAVGVGIDLGADDVIASSTGTVTASFLKGAPLGVIFDQIYAENGAQSAGKGKLRHASPAASTLAAQGGIATGVAFANKLQKSSSVTVAFLADGAMPQNILDEALAFAARHKLAILYVSCGPSAEPSKKPAWNFPVIPVDGNDVVAVYRVAHECIVRARQGGGPALIECHDDFPGAGPAKPRDPIANMERYLAAKGLFTPKWKQQVLAAFDKKVAAAMATAAKKTARPQGYFDHVYSFPLRAI